MIGHISGLVDVFRVINIALALTFLSTFACTLPTLLRLQRSRVMAGWALLAFVLTSAWGSLETLVWATPAPGIRTFLTTAALSWATCAQILTWWDNRKPKEIST